MGLHVILEQDDSSYFVGVFFFLTVFFLHSTCNEGLLCYFGGKSFVNQVQGDVRKLLPEATGKPFYVLGGIGRGTIEVLRQAQYKGLNAFLLVVLDEKSHYLLGLYGIQGSGNEFEWVTDSQSYPLGSVIYSHESSHEKRIEE
jgi:hypothetical protein